MLALELLSLTSDQTEMGNDVKTPHFERNSTRKYDELKCFVRRGRSRKLDCVTSALVRIRLKI